MLYMIQSISILLLFPFILSLIRISFVLNLLLYIPRFPLNLILHITRVYNLLNPSHHRLSLHLLIFPFSFPFHTFSLLFLLLFPALSFTLILSFITFSFLHSLFLALPVFSLTLLRLTFPFSFPFGLLLLPFTLPFFWLINLDQIQLFDAVLAKRLSHKNALLYFLIDFCLPLDVSFQARALVELQGVLAVEVLVDALDVPVEEKHRVRVVYRYHLREVD
mmetsp:Transcript_12006/g.13642  ORF Transcript_12006/g.13642 Transcript_12006/m.13642 type:complete len:220 (-) Transcript_12006:751-1410(-)